MSDMTPNEIARKVIAKGDLSQLDQEVAFSIRNHVNIIQVTSIYIFINGIYYDKHGCEQEFVSRLIRAKEIEAEEAKNENLKIIEELLGDSDVQRYGMYGEEV